MLRTTSLVALVCALGASNVQAQHSLLEPPALGFDRTNQDDIADGTLTYDEIREAGLKMFATPFNTSDGFGDGPMNPADPTTPGGRPSLVGAGGLLRVNGLDAQSCLECHGVASFATVPSRFGVGGVGGSNNNVIAGPTEIDVDDEAGNGMAMMDGRFINPPFVFGAGGVELLGKEMTLELQRRKALAQRNPDTPVNLVSKGVSFGSILFDSQSQTFDTSAVEGVDEDLVVRPFGRKGQFISVRDFGLGAMEFHFGMQPSERVGQNVDGDGDGVTDEIRVGEMSAMHVFLTSLERPVVSGVTSQSLEGATRFAQIGCADCHTPTMQTRSKVLGYSFPEVPVDPLANQYYRANLQAGPSGFASNGSGGLEVPLFSDLKRHDMGPGLAEFTGGSLDSMFITARLWGVADTAPYMHDGRALSLNEAIEMHGGEAAAARNAYVALPVAERAKILAFLGTLRTPQDPAGDLVD